MLDKPLLQSLWLCFLLFYAGSSYGEEILVPAPPNLSATAYLLIDFDSGAVLAEHNADQRLSPASLTKIMTVYVAFREIKNGNLKLDDKVTVSEKAWQTPGSRMFIEVNTRVEVEKLLKGIIISSGNDASVALAEHIAGDESTFAQLMNQQAMRLGMSNTHFMNSMGLPDENHYTTARDLATLTRALIREFPDLYTWHSIKEFTYNKITQPNRNQLLWRDASVDGVKTGHTEEAGFCLVASAKKDDMRLISVVMGTESTDARASQNQSLLNYGFRFFSTHPLYKANEALAESRIWKGEKKKLQLGLKNNLYVTIPRRHFKDLKATLQIDEKIMAPINRGDRYGFLSVKLGDKVYVSEPLTALESIPLGGLFRRLYDEALLMIE